MNTALKVVETAPLKVAPVRLASKQLRAREAKTSQLVNRLQSTQLRARARGTLYHPLIVSRIITRISNCESLVHICNREGYPSRSTVASWIRNKPEFRRQYQAAKGWACETYMEEILMIADDETIPIQKARLMIDVRKWTICHLMPKKYGRW